MGFMDLGRDAVDKAVREVGQEFWREAEAIGANLYQAVVEVANKRGVDPGYVLYIVLTQEMSWRRLAGENADALNIAKRLYVRSDHEQPDEVFKLPPADQESAVEAALTDLGEWAATGFQNDLTQAFLTVARSGGEKVKAALEATYEKPATTKQARQTLMRELALRVKDHPFWFQDSITLHQILGMLFAVKS